MKHLLIQEPIDYVALSKAYQACKWKWSVPGTRFSKVPNADEIIETVKMLKRSVESGETNYNSTGGITVEKVGESIVVSIDRKLMANYQKPLSDLVPSGDGGVQGENSHATPPVVE